MNREQLKDDTETLVSILEELATKGPSLSKPRLRYLSDKIVEHGYNIRALTEE